MNWTTLITLLPTLGLLIGAYWYAEDLRREVRETLEAQQLAFEREAERDAAWLDLDSSDHERMLLAVQGLASGLANILPDLSNDIGRLLERLETLMHELRFIEGDP